MSRDVHRPSVPSQAFAALPPDVAECAALGARLSRASVAERDLAWHVMSYHVGDLGALVSARLAASDTTAPDR